MRRTHNVRQSAASPPQNHKRATKLDPKTQPIHSKQQPERGRSGTPRASPPPTAPHHGPPASLVPPPSLRQGPKKREHPGTARHGSGTNRPQGVRLLRHKQKERKSEQKNSITAKGQAKPPLRLPNVLGGKSIENAQKSHAFLLKRVYLNRHVSVGKQLLCEKKGEKKVRAKKKRY